MKRQPERTTIYKDDICELVKFKWKKYDHIPYHAHPGIKCYFLVLKGLLLEKRCNGRVYVLREENKFSYIEDTCEMHSVKALNPTTSIHLYLKKDTLSKL